MAYKVVKTGEVKIDSLIKKNFTDEFMKKIYDVYSDKLMSITEKTERYDEMFNMEFGNRLDYRRIGEGTNRFVCLLDSHVIKVAYNYLAFIDNMNELAVAKYKSSWLARAYETNGLILVSEYVTAMDREEFIENQREITNILDKLKLDAEQGVHPSKYPYYILGDMGVSDKNYGNWGRRVDGTIVVLDYGYMYKVASEYWKDVAKCPICGSSVEYADNYSEFKCTNDQCAGFNNPDSYTKYTTLRNNYGYENIINNIKQELSADKKGKFGKDGSITIDIMKRVYEPDPEPEPFKMPADIEEKMFNAQSKFFDISVLIENNHNGVNDNKIYHMKKELLDNRDEYDEKLFPMVYGLCTASKRMLSKCKFDFEERYKEVYKDHQEKIEDAEFKEIVDELDLMPDFTEEDMAEGMAVNSYESGMKTIIDDFNKSNNEEIYQPEFSFDSKGYEKKPTDDDIANSIKSALMLSVDSLDALSQEMDDCKETSLESLLNKYVSFEENNSNDGVENKVKSKDLEGDLESAYNRLKKSVMELVEEQYDDDELKDEAWTTGDVYHTLLNGETIDTQYSPEVNTTNILGGYKPEDFAYPLYRHLLVKMDYDSDETFDEFELIYKLTETIEPPQDIYDNDSNIALTIKAIGAKISTKIPYYILRTRLSRDLKRYYELLDQYYEDYEVKNAETPITSPDYFYEIASKSREMKETFKDALDNLEDELIDQGLRLSDELKTKRVVYYYAVEDRMDAREKSLMKSLRRIKLRKNVRSEELDNEILNNYFKVYGSTITDDVLNVVKYAQSYEPVNFKYVGKELVKKPVLKAKLVDKDSKEDTFKPKIFTRRTMVNLDVENRYSMKFRADVDESTQLNDVLTRLNMYNLTYRKWKTSEYTMKLTDNNLNFLLTQEEKEYYDKFIESYSDTTIKDEYHIYSGAIVDLIIKDSNKKLHPYTLNFLHDLGNKGMAQAFLNRQELINVMELSGKMTRLELLESIK